MTEKPFAVRSSSVRLARLMVYLAENGSMRMSEIAPLLGVSHVTVAYYVRALQYGNWIAFGRQAVGDDRKIRLCEKGALHTVRIGHMHVRTLSQTIGTGACERHALSLCEAIPEDEARQAVLGRLLDAWEACERTESRLGVILEDGVSFPEGERLGLSASQIVTRETLTVRALVRMYGESDVLYVRYGDVPTLRLLTGGTVLSALRPDHDLKKHWPTAAEERIDEMAKQIFRILMLLVPKTIVVEADGGGSDAVAEALREALTGSGDAACPEIRAVGEASLAEEEMLALLRERLCEQILAADREGRK